MKSTCCDAPVWESTYKDAKLQGGEKPMYQCSKCRLACGVIVGDECARCDTGKRLECSEPCTRFTGPHEHACPDCKRNRLIMTPPQPSTAVAVPEPINTTGGPFDGPAPVGSVPFPMAELMKPKIVVLIESSDSKHYVQVKIDRLQYERLELMLGCDQDSVNKAVVGAIEFPLKFGDQAVPGRYFERMATFYSLRDLDRGGTDGGTIKP